jgi:TonB family protein
MLAAILISLLIHLILAGYIRWPFNQPSSENEVVRVRQINIARIPPHTPPPTPLPTPRVTPAAKPKVIPPALHTRSSKGPPVAHVIAVASAAPTSPPQTPAPTPLATSAAVACLTHDISPAVTSTAQPVDIPPQARASKASGTAEIHVEIDQDGHVTNTTVAQSSGDAGLDGVAMQMAKDATYTPALIKCKPVASVYTYTVEFKAW